jgi:hypothetical protein
MKHSVSGSGSVPVFQTKIITVTEFDPIGEGTFNLWTKSMMLMISDVVAMVRILANRVT